MVEITIMNEEQIDLSLHGKLVYTVVTTNQELANSRGKETSHRDAQQLFFSVLSEMRVRAIPSLRQVFLLLL